MNGHVRVLLVVTLLFCSIAQSQLSLNFFARGVCPKQDELFALGFYNGKISLIGGENIGRSLVDFDVDTEQFSDYGSSALTNIVGGGQYNQFHVQNGNFVYMINPAGTFLQRYDLASKTLTNNWKQIPTGTDIDGCLTTDGAVLYVVGGGGSGTSWKTVQRLSLSTGGWLAGRSMQSTRREASCAYNAYKSALYVIGGYVSGTNLNTVEWNTLSRISSGNAFSTLSNRLNAPTLNSFAVSSGTKVYVLGGYVSTASDTSNYKTVDTIHVIETSTNTISVSPNRLAIDVGSFSGILVNDDIYVFTGDGHGGGNYNGYGSVRDWQTTKATAQPTKAPTDQPTPAPTAPADITCGDATLSGDYNGQTVAFSVVLAYDGHLTFDARPSPMPVTSLANLAPPGVMDNGSGDANSASGVILLRGLTAGTYRFQLNLGVGAGQFSVVTQCSSDAPSKVPTKLPTQLPTKVPTASPTRTPTATPTTPSPTEPGEINCGDSVEGAYGGVAVTISVNMAFEGAMTFDARASSLAIPTSGLRRSSSPGVLDNGLGDEDANAGVLTISNLDAGTYQYLLDFGADTGTFSIATQCRSDAPTKAPAVNPTRAPNLDPTKSPTPAPTDMPSLQPTLFPTDSPSNPPTENASGEVREDDDEDEDVDGGQLIGGPEEEEIWTLLGLGFSNTELMVVAATLFIVCVCCLASLYILRRVRQFKKQQVDTVARMAAHGPQVDIIGEGEYDAGDGDRRGTFAE